MMQVVVNTLEAEADMPSPQPARILLVDDDSRNLLALTQALAGLGEIVTATSGRDALRELLRGDFAVILLDVYMPGMDGYETAKLIREREQTARIPIIFASAVNKEAEHLMRGYEMGAVDYVFKPIDPVVLKSKVSVFVDLYTMRQQVLEQARAEQAEREARYRAEAERLEVEHELHQTRLRQASIVEAVPLALYEAEPGGEGCLIRRFVGGDLAKVVGEADAEAVLSGALCWEDRIPEEDAFEVGRRMAAPSGLLRYRWRRSDGEVIHILEQRASSDADGRAFVGTLIDNTQQRRLEQQLLQAGKLDAIGQLTGGIAHDFNNLLAAVLGGMSLIERRVVLPEREKDILSQMRHAAEKGVELVRRMMAFARRQELDPVCIAPVDLQKSVAALVENTLGGTYRVEWRCDASQNFSADQSQLELALVNLVINARDAMPQGGTIEVVMSDVRPQRAKEAGLADGDYLCLRVSDCGMGIPPELVDKITEPFFTTKGVGKGTGLGLSMVFGFVQQSGGKVLIDSEPGHGTTVELFLPATAEAARPVVEPTREEEAELSARTVLLVDDDDTVRMIVSEQLTDLGVDVTIAHDGARAIEIIGAADKPFDFMLTDFAMPGMNGLQAIRRARELDPDLKVAIMTGHPVEELDGISGDIPVLTKPVSLANLRMTLKCREVAQAS